jgi:hypothetical protein
VKLLTHLGMGFTEMVDNMNWRVRLDGFCQLFVSRVSYNAVLFDASL